MRQFNFFYDYYPLILKSMSKDQAKEILNIRFGGASERSRRYNEIEKLKKELTKRSDINMDLIYLLKAIKMVCKVHPNCEECDFQKEGTTCCLFDEMPEDWDLKEIQNAIAKE